MANSENLFDIIAFGKCEVPYTKRQYSFCTIIILDSWLRHFWPQGHSLNKLGRCPLGDATNQISRPWGFRQDVFIIISLCDPCGGAYLAPWALFEQTR